MNPSPSSRLNSAQRSQPRVNHRLATAGLLLAVGLQHAAAAANNNILAVPAGGYQTTSYANGIQLVGTTAYLAAGEQGLVILDASDPTNLVEKGVFDSPGTAYSVEIVGNTAYLSDYEAGWRIVDISNPASPVQLGEYASDVMVIDSKVVGNRAYLACLEGGLQILDISDPAKPVKLGDYVRVVDDFPQSISKVKLIGNTAFLCGTGLEIVDVSDPTAPKQIGIWEKNFVANVEVVGNLAYICTVSDGLIALDIKDPSKPVRVTRVPAGAGAASALFVGNVAYTETGMVDISDPVSPVSLGSIPYTVWSDTGLRVLGDFVFIPTGLARLEVARIRYGTPQTLTWSGADDRVVPVGTTEAIGVAGSSGLPVKLEVLSGPGVFAGNQLTVNGPGKLLVKASQPGDATYFPVEATRFINQKFARLTDLLTFGFGTNIYGATVVGNRVYVGNDALGMQILDITDPAKPVILGTVESTGMTFEADVVGNLAYIADGPGGFKIADITDPANPKLLSKLDTGTSIAVRVYGNTAYVADFAGRQFFIVDVTDPAQPVTLSKIDVRGEPRFVKLIGNLLYTANGFGGLSLFDVSNLKAPEKVAQIYANGQVRGFELVGNVILIPDYSRGTLTSHDISDPKNPVALGKIDLKGSPRRVKVVGDQAIVVCESGGLQVVDISDPTHLTLMASAPTGDFARDIQVIGTTLHLADQNSGYRVFSLDSVGYRPNLDVTLPAATTFGGATPVAGTSTSGKAVNFSVTYGPGRIEAGQLVPTGVGLIQVQASVDGGNGFLPGTRDLQIVAGMPAITLRRTGASLEAAWPAGLANARLEGATGLDGLIGWTTLPATVSEAGAESRVSVSPADARGFLRLASDYPGVAEPLELTGWNRDVVLENSAKPTAQPFDLNDAAWFETGLDGYSNGLPPSRDIVNQFDPLVRYQLQPYTGNNVLWLNEGTRTATLTSAQPTACSRLYILAASNYERGASGKLVIHYVDGTTSGKLTFSARAWYGEYFDGTPVPGIFAGVGRSTSSKELNYTGGNYGFSMYQTEIELGSGPGAGKAIASLEFTMSDAPQITTGIFAVSGIRIPSKP